MDQVKIGQLIRTLRTQRGLTQKALAEDIGVWDVRTCPFFRKFQGFLVLGWRPCSPASWTPTTRKEEI